MVSPLLTEVPGCFVAAAGVALIFQQRKLALRSFQAGLAAIISGAILLNIACVVMGAEKAISFMPASAWRRATVAPRAAT